MVNLKEFISAIDQIAEEKGINQEQVSDIIAQSLAAAYKKDYGERGQNIKVQLDTKKGKGNFFQSFLVVDESMVLSEEEVAALQTARDEAQEKGTDETSLPEPRFDSPQEQDDEEEEETKEGEEPKKIRFNPKRHLMLEEARKIQKDAKPGDEILIPLESKDEFGRIAAQTAKQVIIQRIREAERDAVFETFKEKEGEIVSGVVQRIERGMVYLDIGRTSGVLFPEEQIPHERYRQSQRVRVYVVRVSKDSRGPVIVLSRRHPGIVAKLFELEVPEIPAGAVEIKAIAREAGSRSKVAVASNEEGIDPVGACVGQKGIRVGAVINELGGENIDIIAWDEEQEAFIANALSPAKVISVELNEGTHTATVDVREDQLSLAIGRRGQNVRLAAKLTGWKIDVRGAEKVLEEEGVSEAEHKKEIEEAAESANGGETSIEPGSEKEVLKNESR